MNISIRKARIEDIPRIKRIDRFGNQLRRYSGLDRLDRNYKPKKNEKGYFETFVTGKKKWCYVAEQKNMLVGFALFNIENRAAYFKIKKVGYIDLVYVDKNARGKGVAKMLMNTLISIFSQEGIKHLKLAVHTDNPAHKAWKRLGFKDYRAEMWKKL